MTTICFDLSMSNTGVAIFDDAGECVSLVSIETKKEDSHPFRLQTIGKAFKKIKKEYKPSLVIVEESFSRFNNSTHAIYKVRGVMEYVFYDIPMEFYHGTTVRKEVLGRGNSTKEEIQDYIIKSNPKIKFEDLDQSDAFALYLCHLKKKGDTSRVKKNI